MKTSERASAPPRHVVGELNLAVVFQIASVLCPVGVDRWLGGGSSGGKPDLDPFAGTDTGPSVRPMDGREDVCWLNTDVVGGASSRILQKFQAVFAVCRRKARRFGYRGRCISQSLFFGNLRDDFRADVIQIGLHSCGRLLRSGGLDECRNPHAESGCAQCNANPYVPFLSPQHTPNLSQRNVSSGHTGTVS